jgi:predicted Zn finger-like uncharacterized protein
MIATCPSCATRYNLPDEALGFKGRTVRCVNCGHKWRQTLSGEDTIAVADIPLTGRDIPLSAQTEGRRQTSKSRIETKGSFVPKFIAATIVLLIALGGLTALALLKTRVIAAWPATARLYAVLGSPVTVLGEGLEFQNVVSTFHAEDGSIKLEGNIHNTTTLTRAVPQMKATLVGDSGPIKTWNFRPDSGTLAPGASLPFVNVLNDVKGVEGNILLTFSSDNNEARK